MQRCTVSIIAVVSNWYQPIIGRFADNPYQPISMLVLADCRFALCGLHITEIFLCMHLCISFVET